MPLLDGTYTYKKIPGTKDGQLAKIERRDATGETVIKTFTKAGIGGEGSFGSVIFYKAEDGETLAVKEILRRDDVPITNLEKEGEITQLADIAYGFFQSKASEKSKRQGKKYLTYRSDLTAHYISYSDEKIFIVMPVIAGETLYEYILLKRKLTSRAALFSIIRQLFERLQELHAKDIIHADLKLLNLLFDEETNSLKIIDFGMSCKAQEGKDIKVRQGTSGHLAPEVMRSSEENVEYNRSTDYYAAAMTVFAILSDLPTHSLLVLHWQNFACLRKQIDLEKYLNRELTENARLLKPEEQTFFVELLSPMLAYAPEERPKYEKKSTQLPSQQIDAFIAKHKINLDPALEKKNNHLVSFIKQLSHLVSVSIQILEKKTRASVFNYASETNKLCLKKALGIKGDQQDATTLYAIAKELTSLRQKSHNIEISAKIYQQNWDLLTKLRSNLSACIETHLNEKNFETSLQSKISDGFGDFFSQHREGTLLPNNSYSSARTARDIRTAIGKRLSAFKQHELNLAPEKASVQVDEGSVRRLNPTPT